MTTTPKLAPAIDTLMQTHAPGYVGCYLTEGDPEALTADEGEEPLLPPRYLSAPYEIDGDGQLLSLKDDWKAPSDEDPEEPAE